MPIILYSAICPTHKAHPGRLERWREITPESPAFREEKDSFTNYRLQNKTNLLYLNVKPEKIMVTAIKIMISCVSVLHEGDCNNHVNF